MGLQIALDGCHNRYFFPRQLPASFTKHPDPNVHSRILYSYTAAEQLAGLRRVPTRHRGQTVGQQLVLEVMLADEDVEDVAPVRSRTATCFTGTSIFMILALGW